MNLLATFSAAGNPLAGIETGSDLAWPYGSSSRLVDRDDIRATKSKVGAQARLFFVLL
jgi:hypothetical protein